MLFTAILASIAIGAVANAAAALDIDATNSLPLKGGPALFYNGSGPVPPFSSEGPRAPALPILSPTEIEEAIFRDLQAIRTTSALAADNCTKCIAAHEVMHMVALTQPASTVANLLVRSCEAGGWAPRLRNAAGSCSDQFSQKGNMGVWWAQLFANMSVATGDMQIFCAYQFGACKPPETVLIDESKWFSPKPESQSKAPKPSGKTFKVLHLTDSHLDERYTIGSEANCTEYMCCRAESTNSQLRTTVANASLPATRFGHTHCDPPADLILSTFQDMPNFVDMSEVEFALFTGDAVAHDNDDQLSIEYVAYEEEITYRTFKAQLGDIPVFATLGNHDSMPQAYEMQHNIRPEGSAMSWNHELVASLWHDVDWISSEEAQHAASHYSAYATTTKQGLKIIALNTDFWYIDNVFNYINYTNPDTSGMLSFLIEELEAAEKAGQRAWIIGHVPTGYDYFSPLPNPTALFYAIVRRFSPSTIAGIFFGHTHQDQFNVYYDFKPSSLINGTTLRNTTDVDYDRPLNVAYMAPSISPLTGYNAGWRIYEVDAETFDVLDHTSYISDMSQSTKWTTSPVWDFEYSALDAYDAKRSWPSIKTCTNNKDCTPAPLNATFWNKVASAMLTEPAVAATFGKFETKSSIFTRPCNTTTCAQTKYCAIRSASGGLLNQCPGVTTFLFDGPLGGTR